MQKDLLKKSQQHLEKNIVEVKNIDEMIKSIENKKMVKTGFCGSTECEDYIKEKTGGASSRCIPFKQEIKKTDKCIYCNKNAKEIGYFARSY